MNDKLRILVSVTEAEGLAGGVLAKLRQCYPDADIRKSPRMDESGQAIRTELMKGVRILYCDAPPANFDDFDRLEWIHLTSAGYTTAAAGGYSLIEKFDASMAMRAAMSDSDMLDGGSISSGYISARSR